MPPYQVEQRKQENPDDVDEVPVETDDFDGRVIAVSERAVVSPDEHPDHQAHTDDHVQRVQARHHEVERKENLRGSGELRVEREERARNEVLVKLVRVLDALDAEEHAAEDHRQRDENHDPLARVQLRRVHRERHRQAAADEHGGVDGSERDVEVMARGRERCGIPHPVDRVDDEQRAEEQNFGQQKHPHPERRGLLLLVEVVEVVRERRMMRRVRRRVVMQRASPRVTDSCTGSR